MLYLKGLFDNMTKGVAITMIGNDGVKYERVVTKKDLKKKSEFDIVIITAGTEQTMQGVEKKNKLTFLQ
jgi:hypothetical protein